MPGDTITTLGQIDQGTYYAAGSADQKERLSNYRHQLVDQGLPPYAELVRMGKVFSLSGGVIANGAIPVADMPTTACLHALYNGNASGSDICLLPIRVATYAASGTLGLGRAMIGGVTATVQSAAVANGTGAVGPNNNFPTSTNTSKATWGLSTTLAAAPAWTVLAGLDTPAAVEVGAGLVADMFGMFIVPPGMCFAIHVLAPTGTTAKFLGTITYAEIQMKPQ